MEQVFDAHCHHNFDMPIEKAVEIFREEFKMTGTEKAIFLAIPHHVKSGRLVLDKEQNKNALYLKKAFYPNGYAFAGLVHPLDGVYTEKTSCDFLAQVQKYMSEGYDGIKMLEGYPDIRKFMGIKLCDEVYDKFYSYCEYSGVPITMHMANPVENWDIKKADKYAIEHGRVYDDTFPTKEELTQEVFLIMEKHPRLRLTLAHFGFMSYDIAVAEKFMSYQNTVFDLTPGGEQLLNMATSWNKWLPFFEKYQDRIVYGTDMYAFPKDFEGGWEQAVYRRPNLIRQLFETDTEHEYIGEKFQGIKLDEKIRRKIYFENAIKLFGEPKKIV